MALATVKHHSYTLRREAEFQILLPDRPSQDPLPVLYVLHGHGDNNHAWLSGTDIAQYVQGKHLAVVFPFGSNSFYCDVADGAYYSYISSELIEFTANTFHLSDKREEHFILGNSMGGFGAYKLALHHPDYFSAAASFSGCMDISHIAQHHPGLLGMFPTPQAAVCPENDLPALIEALSHRPVQPRFYQWCGTEDYLLQLNRAFHQHAAALPLQSYIYEESAGDHDWPSWDQQLRRALEWFGI